MRQIPNQRLLPESVRFPARYLSNTALLKTVNLDHIRHHYFRSHKTINPTGIISIGPWQ